MDFITKLEFALILILLQEPLYSLQNNDKWLDSSIRKKIGEKKQKLWQ